MNYSKRRQVETSHRDLFWLDNQPLPVRQRPQEAEYPIRKDEKTVIRVRASRLHRYFPLPFRSETMAEYMAKHDADPKNFFV